MSLLIVSLVVIPTFFSCVAEKKLEIPSTDLSVRHVTSTIDTLYEDVVTGWTNRRGAKFVLLNGDTINIRGTHQIIYRRLK